jgi:hypothetical protein
MLERGAVECLFKPFSEMALLDAQCGTSSELIDSPGSCSLRVYNEFSKRTWLRIEVIAHDARHANCVRC